MFPSSAMYPSTRHAKRPDRTMPIHPFAHPNSRTMCIGIFTVSSSEDFRNRFQARECWQPPANSMIELEKGLRCRECCCAVGRIPDRTLFNERRNARVRFAPLLQSVEILHLFLTIHGYKVAIWFDCSG